MEAQLTKARDRIDREATVRLAAHDDRAHILLSHSAYLHHRQQWQRLLDDSEDALAQHQPYLLDRDRFSLVDIYATSFLFWYLQKVDPSAESVFTGRRRLEQYYYRQLDRSSVRDAFNLS
jgi:glutathione S-transferase